MIANEIMKCKCGRSLTEKYARELGMCIECKLKHVRRFQGEMRWTSLYEKERRGRRAKQRLEVEDAD